MSALAESSFGNNLGFDVDLKSFSWNQLWSETGSLFIVSVSDANKKNFEEHFKAECKLLGKTLSQPNFKWKFADGTYEGPLKDFLTVWSQGVENVYNA